MRQLALFVIAFGLTILVCEIFLRTSNIASVSSVEFYDDIGRGVRKNLDYVYFNEGFGIGRYNEYRYLGESNPPEKGDNTVRVILLGDSFVESFQIFERDYFGNVAENRLSTRFPEKKFEFLNFGRSGFDISDMYAYQKTFAEKFDPDLILYMVSNDDLEIKYADPLMPRTLLKKDSLLIEFNFSPSKLTTYQNTKKLTQNFSILQMLNIGRKKVKTTPFWSIILGKFYSGSMEERKHKGRKSDEEYSINPVTKRIVKSLDSEKVIFVNRDEKQLPILFEKLCSNNGFRYFDLSIPLNLMKNQGIDPYEWKVTKKRGHWNQKAHKVIGQEIADKLIDILTVK